MSLQCLNFRTLQEYDEWIEKQTKGMVQGENGEWAHETTQDPRLDFFFKTLRDTPHNQVESYLWEMKNTGVEMTHILRLVFHLRDCRGGKGEREAFRTCLRWLATQGAIVPLLANIKHIPTFGRWDDLFCLVGTPAEDFALTLFALTVVDDKHRLVTGDINNITVAAKWSPTEGGSLDRRQSPGITFKIANKVWELSHGPNSPRTNGSRPNKTTILKYYRKQFIGPLRNKLALVETKMCGKLWDEIEYEHVPSLCMFKHRKAFERHSEESFKAYIEAVKKGDKKIKATTVFPHQMVAHYMNNGSATVDDVIEEQWKALIENIKTQVNSGESDLGSCLAVVDVSGSMMGTPMEVAVALGLIISEIAPPPFKGTAITFSSDPQIHHIRGDTLRDRVQNLTKANWGMTTNYQKVFNLIINECNKHNIPPEKRPKRLFVFSDMQFDQSGGVGVTAHTTMMQKFKKFGYDVPEIVFWNLRGDTPGFPATNADSGVVMVSGFSPALMQLFTESGDLSPGKLIDRIINNPRYEPISVPENVDIDSIFETSGVN